MSRRHINPEVIDLLLFYLRQKLRGRFRDVSDEHMLEASIEDALLRWDTYPEQFDMSRSPDLGKFLTWWVRSYLDARKRKEKRHRRHERAVGVSERFFEKIVSEVRGERCIYIGRDRSEQETEELNNSNQMPYRGHS